MSPPRLPPSAPARVSRVRAAPQCRARCTVPVGPSRGIKADLLSEKRLARSTDAGARSRGSSPNNSGRRVYRRRRNARRLPAMRVSSGKAQRYSKRWARPSTPVATIRGARAVTTPETSPPWPPKAHRFLLMHLPKGRISSASRSSSPALCFARPARRPRAARDPPKGALSRTKDIPQRGWFAIVLARASIPLTN